MPDRLRRDLQLGTFANLVAKDLQLAKRMEAADRHGMCECVTCGKRGHYKTMHGGHFIPGRRQSVLFVEENIHVQCVRCNNYLSGNVAEYERFMIKKYGEPTVERLRAARHTHTAYTRLELADMRDSYRKRIKQQKKRLGER